MESSAQTRLIYEGTDITEDVDIIECVHRDVSGGASDCLILEVDHAEKWMRWGPQRNDTIQVTRNGYDSKRLYLNTVIPEDGAFRIYATGAKSMPFPARWQSFKDKTLAAIMASCAGECGMGARQHGVSGGILYAYMLRDNKSVPTFLETLANREGAVLKCLDGNFIAIGVNYAQGLPAMHEMRLESDQLSSKYINRRDMLWSSVRIETPFGNGDAHDSAASGSQSMIITDIPVDDSAQAKRWAKGLLLMHNRQAETLEIEMDFNPGFTAMVRIDVLSDTDAKGQWIIDEVEQNLLDGRSKAKLLRCVTTVW